MAFALQAVLYKDQTSHKQWQVGKFRSKFVAVWQLTRLLSFPFWIAFRLKQGKQYIYSEDALDAESFIKFVEEGYKLAASQPVPPPISKL